MGSEEGAAWAFLSAREVRLSARDSRAAEASLRELQVPAFARFGVDRARGRRRSGDRRERTTGFTDAACGSHASQRQRVLLRVMQVSRAAQRCALAHLDTPRDV